MIIYYLDKAKKQRCCHYCTKVIPSGTIHMAYDKPTNFGRTNRKNFCVKCAQVELDETYDSLNILRSTLVNQSPIPLPFQIVRVI